MSKNKISMAFTPESTRYICKECNKYVRVSPVISIDIDSMPMPGIKCDSYKHILQYDRIYLHCPWCGHEMFQCDEEIADSIVLFNIMGYYTAECCAGHDKPNPYVLFENSLEESQMVNIELAAIEIINRYPEAAMFETDVIQHSYDPEDRRLIIRLKSEYRDAYDNRKTILDRNFVFPIFISRIAEHLANEYGQEGGVNK